MRIEFDENGYDYVELKESEGGVSLVISSRDLKSPRSAIVNSAEITKDQFLEIVSKVITEEEYLALAAKMTK